MRALGENPAAVDAVGVNVFGLRYLYVIMGGALAGLGGAYLSLAYAPCWLENMTAGRGWIAVALVIFALWDPWRALLGSYLFGGIDALGFHLQVVGLPVSVFILNMLPYIFLCFMSFVSFAVAFLAYGLVIRLMGTTSSASRYSQIILVPIAIIGYDFLTITAPAEYRYVIGGLPMLLLGLMLLYYRFGKGGSMDDAPAPSEIKKVSKKSLKHQAKKNKVK